MADVSAYDSIFKDAGAEWNVDPTLLKALAAQESQGDPTATSKKGARGLMQIMPDTARGLGVTDITDPVQSIFAGAKYMNEALNNEGTPERALLYYHGGPGWRQAYGPESRAYVPGVAAHYQQFAKANAHAATDAASVPASQGPLILGDSLASKGGLGGTGIVGAHPKVVLDSIAAMSGDAVKGRDVVLSGGSSNNPAQASLTFEQVKTLKDKGANSVTIVGVGDRPDLAGVNDTLSGIADRSGARFVPLDPATLGPDRIHPTGAGYKALQAAVAPPAASSPPPAASVPAMPTAPAKTDPFSAALEAAKSGNDTASGAASDPFSSAVEAAKAEAGTAQKDQPPPASGTTARGVARNVAAGTLEGSGGVLNFLSDPAGNLLHMAAVGGGTAFDAAAHALGYEGMSPEQRADLYGTSPADQPYQSQPGTTAINALGGVAHALGGDAPSDVVPASRAEELVRKGATAGTALATVGPAGIRGILPMMTAGAGGGVVGDVAASYVPEWAKPGTEMVANALGTVGTGVALHGARAGVNALAQGVNRLGNGPPPPAVPPAIGPPSGAPPGGGGPSPGMGGAPQPASVGAAASRQGTPAAAINLTPEETANARTVANKQWLNNPVQPGIRDTNADIPGVTANLAEQEQTVQAARELKALKTANPELTQEEKLILDKNSRERKSYFDDTIGSDITRAGDLKAANKKIETDLATVWKGKGEADPAGVHAQIETELKSSAGDLPPVQSAMQQIRESLEKAGTDPEAMYRTRRLINYLQSREGQRANPGYGHDSVQAALTRVKAALDQQAIEPAAPGFKQAMSDYADARGPIDAAKALQDRENGLYDSRGHMQFLPIHKLVRDIIEAQRWDAPDNPLQFVSDEQMARLQRLHDNLKRVASAQDLAAARGSDTVQNAMDVAKGVAKAGGAIVAHAVANKVAPVAGSFVVNALGQAIERGRAGRVQRRQMQRGMEMLNPPPTNPLNPPP